MNRPPITHVAIRFRGEVYSLPPPNRHHHVMWMVADLTKAEFIDAHGEDQGFLDSTGRYLNRKQALVSALANGQVKSVDDIRCGMLFSEDVW